MSTLDPRRDPAWLPLRAGLRLLRALPAAASRSSRRDPGWQPGLSVLLPDRDRPDLLASSLPALAAALARLDEPWEVWISTSAAAPPRYAALRRQFPNFHWLFSSRPLGFSGAIGRALPRLRYDHIYLLNSDMQLDSQALLAVLALRGPRVFAIASQIHHAEPGVRREETGLTALCEFARPSRLYDAWPGDDPQPREHLYAGGGASLFRRTLLCDYAAASGVYEPVYWEDVEWGLRAWGEGWRVLFCPASVAWHGHRSTVRQVFSEAEIARLFARNGLWFDLRHAAADQLGSALDRVVCASATSAAEARNAGFALATLAQRWRCRRRSLSSAWFLRDDSLQLGFGRAPRGRPRLLLVTPFALLPTSHGSARRCLELLRGLADQFDLALLSDEGAAYPPGHEAELAALCVLWLRIDGRLMESANEDWRARGARHVWPGLRAGLAEARRQFGPQQVLVAHAELLDLGRERAVGEHWSLDLHDVPALSEDAEQCWFEDGLAYYDRVIACSADDLADLPAAPRHDGRAVLIENGATLRPGLPPSPVSPPRLLFVGGLRYPPNRVGLQAFLDHAWPRLRGAIPGLRLALAGISAAEAAEYLKGLDAAIEPLGVVSDLGPLYSAATLCLNPLVATRGSALKVIEALAAGRICVSTREGARGLADAGFAGLRCTPNVEAMVEEILALLADPVRRHRLEQFDAERLATVAWSARARALVAALAAPHRDRARQLVALPG